MSLLVEFKKDMKAPKGKGCAAKDEHLPVVHKKGDRIRKSYKEAGKLAAAGFVDILDENKDKVPIKNSK